MTALKRLRPVDLERLSAYVDGALEAREQADLAARLGREAELRQALDELRLVKAAIAGLPERHPPKSFTLRPSDVARRAAGPMFGYLRFATVVASALFVLTTAIRSVPLAGMRAAAPEPQAAAELRSDLELAGAETAAPADELQAEAPLAVPQEAPPEAFALAGTPTPQPTACADCPLAMLTEGNAVGQAAGEEKDDISSERTQRIPPLAFAQGVLGLAALALGILTVRARRR